MNTKESTHFQASVPPLRVMHHSTALEHGLTLTAYKAHGLLQVDTLKMSTLS